MIRLIGDIHGDVDFYFDTANSCRNSIQVGDLGIGFLTPQADDYVNMIQECDNHRFIRGNHDNPHRCDEFNGFIPDGTYEEDTGIFYCGGAYSVDKLYRTENVDWWSAEELNYSESWVIMDLYEKSKPRIMITHDAPVSLVPSLVNAVKSNWKIEPSYTQKFLEELRNIHKPSFHFFGHWHHTSRYVSDKTIFVCIGERDYIDVDITNYDTIHESIMKKFD